MTEPPAGLVVLDATVLSNFASTGAVDWLVGLLDEPAVVPAVASELERGREHGHGFLDEALEPIDDGLALLDPGAARTGPPDRLSLRDELDAGEADSLLAALARGGTLATDDLAARRSAAGHGVPVTGSIGLLAAGVRRDALDEPTANEWLDRWRTRRGYYAPVERIEEVLDDES